MAGSAAGNATYLKMQRNSYANVATTREGAEAAVHPNYAEARAASKSTLAYMLNDYAERNATIRGSDITEVRKEFLEIPKKGAFRALDYGCGVGRNMEELVNSGFAADGVDISPEMLGFAKKSETLAKAGSKFFLSGGQDCGDAPAASYDFVFSVLCFQHICVRSIRSSILQSMHRALKPNGVVSIQFQYYPKITSAQIPQNHAAWSEDKVNAVGTNSAADVWVTADKLHEVHDDFRALFNDVRFQFIEIGTYPGLEKQYEYPFGHLFVSGSKTAGLRDKIYKPV